MKYNKLDYKSIIFFGVYAFFILNVLTVAIPILPRSLYYRFLLIIELLIVAIGIVKYNFRLPHTKNALKIVLLMFMFQLLAYGMDFVLEDFYCFDIHRLAAFVFMYMILYECAKFGKMSSQSYTKLNNVILIVGIVACIYNLIMHKNSILTFNLSTIMYYTSTYTAFFLTRSNFCLLLTICYTISIHRWEENKKIIELCLAIFFALNIFLTNARTSILTISVVSIVFLLSQQKNKVRNIFLFIFIILFSVALPWDSIFVNINEMTQKYALIFRTNSSDISNGRFTLWRHVFQDINPINLLIGHGVGSKDAYLSFIGEFTTSFHNSWVDLFYEGGLLFIAVYWAVFYNVIQYVKYSHLSCINKRLFYSYILILLLCGIGDSVALPFMLDTSTIISTIIFITVPITVANGANKEI